jgi:hypothetical protein
MKLDSELKFAFIVSALIIIVLSVILLSARNDEERSIWAEAYENCVKETYNMTTFQYFEANGVYPNCE